MNLDNPTMEVSYLILVFCSWVWAMSQIRAAWRTPTGWRWSVAFWLSTKAIFLTNAGLIWWFNWTTTRWLELSVYLLVAAHVVTFGQWLRLEHPSEGFDGLPARERRP